MAWALVADTIPLYPLYALLFAHHGLSAGRISAIFAVGSVVGLVAEVPAGAVADRWSRRAALALGALLQAAGFGCWTAWPRTTGFALGFALWGVGGALTSGALEALLYDGLSVEGAEGRFSAVLGRTTAAGLAAQVPAAGLATGLFAAGGYRLVGWVSVAVALVAAVLALRLPEVRPVRAGHEEESEGSYVALLRAGIREAARPEVRGVVVAAALVTGIDAIDEYFPLLAHGWGVAAGAVPLAVLAIPLVGAAAAAIGGRGRPGRWLLAAGLAGTSALLGAATIWHRPSALAVVAVAYGIYRAVLVAVDSRLQAAIDGPARATVTSVAALGTEVAVLAVYGAWAVGRLAAIAVVAVVVAAALPALLRRSRRQHSTNG